MGNRGEWGDVPGPEEEHGANRRPAYSGTPYPGGPYAGGPYPPGGAQQGGRHVGRRFVLGALMVTGAAAAGAVALDITANGNAATDGSREAALAASRRQAARAAARHPHTTVPGTPPAEPTQPAHPATHHATHQADHHTAHTTGHPAHHHGQPPQPTYYVEDGPNVIALTIDDGPNPEYTPQILRILERYKVKASFSMIGQSVGYYPSIAREVADAGHLIVNHTWSHADLPTLSSRRLRNEVIRAQDAIHSATGREPTMLRAPYGAWSPAVLEYLQQRHLTPLDWSVDPQDWARPGIGQIVRTILRTTSSGSIILEHDGGGDRAQTVAALKIVVPRLLDEGFRFTLV